MSDRMRNLYGEIPFRKIKPRLDALLRAHAEDKHDRAENHFAEHSPAGRIIYGERVSMLLPGVTRVRR